MTTQGAILTVLIIIACYVAMFMFAWVALKVYEFRHKSMEHEDTRSERRRSQSEYGKVDNRKINSQNKSLREEVGEELLKEIMPKCKECDEKMHKGCMCCIETASKQIKEICHLSEE